ncbi:MAG TPA: PilZ domain-containing protein [Accumulibacter sp.]|nr:PilZ domain-containing protein [Accumulibacter sp.]
MSEIPEDSSEIPAMPERRANQRLLLRTQAFVLLPDGRVVATRTLNISKGGIGLIADFNPAVGSAFSLRVNLPLRPTGKALFEARVQVANSVFDGAEGGFRLGLQFLGLDPTAAALLGRCLS